MIRISMKQKCRILYITNAILMMVILIFCLHYGTFTRVLDLLQGKDMEDQMSEQMAEQSYFYCRSEIYENCPHTEDDIVFIGDSITDRGEFHEYFHDISVKNRGIEGDTTEGIIERLDTILFVPPKKVFIMIGINDIGNGVDEKIFQENYRSIVERIQESDPETEVYIQSILPVNHDVMINNEGNSRRTAKAINDYNKILKEITETYRGIKYVEVGEQMMNEDGDLDEQYTFDGVHLNSTGYKLWVDAVREYVEN